VPARLDRKTSYNNGSVDEDTGDLVIGNFNKTLQGAGLNRVWSQYSAVSGTGCPYRKHHPRRNERFGWLAGRSGNCDRRVIGVVMETAGANDKLQANRRTGLAGGNQS